MRGFRILFKHRGCLNSVNIWQLHVHENEVWHLGLSECDRFIAVLRRYSPVSHFCYKQIHDLTVIIVIFHNKDFLYHWTFRTVGVDDPSPCLFGLPAAHP